MATRAKAALERVADTFCLQLAEVANSGRCEAKEAATLLYMANTCLLSLNNPTSGSPGTLSDHLYQRELQSDATQESIEELAATTTSVLLRQLAPLSGDLLSTINDSSLPNTVNTQYGIARLMDYLRANIIELCVLIYGAGETPTRQLLGEAIRALLSVLAERYPGQSIEVRVPPYSAVQVGAFGDGPTHRRGTPPNVVETDAKTFLALATGLDDWDRVFSSGRLSVSGAHADETERMLPIYQVRP